MNQSVFCKNMSKSDVQIFYTNNEVKTLKGVYYGMDNRNNFGNSLTGTDSWTSDKWQGK